MLAGVRFGKFAVCVCVCVCVCVRVCACMCVGGWGVRSCMMYLRKFAAAMLHSVFPEPVVLVAVSLPVYNSARIVRMTRCTSACGNLKCM